MAEAVASNKKSGAMGFIVVAVILCAIGAGSGAAFTMFVLKPELATGAKPHEATPAEHAAKSAADGHGGAGGAGGGGDKHDAKAVKAKKIVDMEPVHASLAGSGGTWIRLEAAVVFSGEGKEDHALLVRHIAQDALAYLRSLSLAQIDSAAGLEFVREDLSEIASMRTKGAAEEVLLKTIMVE